MVGSKVLDRVDLLVIRWHLVRKIVVRLGPKILGRGGPVVGHVRGRHGAEAVHPDSKKSIGSERSEPREEDEAMKVNQNDKQLIIGDG